MATLRDYEEQVKKCITEENWTEAYQICNKILSYDPENTTFIRYRNRIEKEVKNINLKALRYEIQQLDHYLKEENYEQYLKEIAPLQIYVTDYPEIGDRIVSAKKLLDKQFATRRNQAFKEIEDEIKAKGDKLDYLMTLQKLDNLYKMDIRKKDVLALAKTVKGNYIRQQLKINEGLIQSNRFEDIIIFLLKLKRIDADNPQVNSVIDKIKNEYQRYKIETKKDFIFKTLEEIKTLYITKKYELCLQLCERVLEIDPTNPVARQTYDKALIKADRQSMKFIVEDILKDYQSFKTTPAFKNKNYIRL